MKAVILAAGMGKRLQEVLMGKPKPLLELKGKSILEYSLDSLNDFVKEVIIVIGYKGEIIKERIGVRYLDLRIKYATNPFPERTGSMHSLYSALIPPEDCLVLDGDVIFNKKVISGLLSHDAENLVAISRPSKSNDEVFVLLNKEGGVVYLNKKNPQKKNLFEFTGISKFSKRFIEKMYELHKNNLNQGILEKYYEDCAYRVSRLIPWKGMLIKETEWSEIDKKEDIIRAENVLKEASLYPLYS